VLCYLLANLTLWRIVRVYAVGDRFGHVLGTGVRLYSLLPEKGKTFVPVSRICSCLPFCVMSLSLFRGVATVYAVKAAGLAIGIGIGSSCIVLVSFAWGIFIFHEPVHSVPGACLAIVALMVGLLGMSYYSSPIVKVEEESYDSVAVTEGRQCIPEPWSLATSMEEEFDSPKEDGSPIVSAQHDDILRSFCNDDDEDDEPHASDNEPDGLMRRNDNTTFAVTAITAVVDGDHTCICGRRVKKRHVGMLAAAFCGIWGGSILAVRTWVKGRASIMHLLTIFCWIVPSHVYPVAHEMVQIRYQRHALPVELFYRRGHCHYRALADPISGQCTVSTWRLCRRLSRPAVLSRSCHVESRWSLGPLVVDWKLL
jgi:hypothetical protein